jgi:aryl-alcohol dehydrogenase-like predicted oxidoreductase
MNTGPRLAAATPLGKPPPEAAALSRRIGYRYHSAHAAPPCRPDMTGFDAPLPPLTLGAVQLGMPYGLGAAATGLTETEAHAILDAALEAGISAIDTARAYGDSEARIGRWLARRRPARPPILVSKFPRLEPGAAGERIARHIEASAAALGVARIDIYLAHRGADLALPGAADSLRALMRDGRIGAFGASVYDPGDAADALNVTGIGALQLPINVAVPAPPELVARARAARVRIFARSAFLQGLLLLAPERLPARLAGAAPVLRALRAVAREAGVTLPALLLAAARAGGPDSIVVGADAPAQVLELATAAAPDPAAVDAAIRAARALPRELADPRRWPKA